MKWISVEDKFPQDGKPVLGFCHNSNEELGWLGIVQIFFYRKTGWHRCELYDKKPVTVLFWTDDFDKPTEMR